MTTTRHFQHKTKDGLIDIAYQISGEGPPLLLLHGFPQTKIIWRKIRTELSKNYTVITPDLRGYGESSKPISQSDHSSYSKREMANDFLALMEHLGFEKFYLVGHDRGGRVSHRLGIDHPHAVIKMMVIDISPTLTMYEQTNHEFAKAYWHWFFLIQDSPLPETLIGSNPEFFLERYIGKRQNNMAIFNDESWQEYVNGIKNPDSLAAMCEDYRAAHTIDLEHDRFDRENSIQLNMPVRVLWGDRGVVHKCFSPIEDWKVVAKDVSGRTLPSGHYIPEEVPEELLAEILQFCKP
jgi:haloacetate dehalogenase